MDEAVQPIEAPDRGHIALAVVAFIFIFAVYVLGSTLLLPDVRMILRPGEASGAFLPNPTREAHDLVIWWSAAVFGMVLAVGTTAWSALLLRKHSPSPLARYALTLFAVSSLIAGGLTVISGNSMVKAAQHFACAPADERPDRPMLCQVPPQFSWIKGRTKTQAERQVSYEPLTFAAAFGRMKTLLNILLQTAAVFLLGTLLTLCAISYREPERTEAHFNVLRSERVIARLFVAAGGILSTIVLTDILFSNWPANAFSSPGGGGRSVAELLSVLTFYFAVMSSLVLALTIVAGRWLAGPSLRLLPERLGEGTLWQRARQSIFRRSTVNALVALSPILTVVAGNPLVRALIETMPAS